MKSLIALLLMWFVLSGYFESFFVICGIFSCIITVILSARLNKILILSSDDNNNVTYKKSFLSITYNTCKYLLWLIYQVALSNYYMIKKTWSFKLNLDPAFRLIKSKQRSDLGMALFANSITFTPGTVSVVVCQAPYTVNVHAIDKSLIADISDFDTKVASALY